MQELLIELGFLPRKSADTSDRVCKACARKVRNARELFSCIKNALANEEASREKDENYTDGKDTNASRIKRQLPTTVCSPERSPQTKKVAKITEHKQACAKSKCLLFDLNRNSETQDDDRFLSSINIDEFLDKSSTQIKVVIVYPDKTVKSHSNFEDKTKSLLLNIVRKKWSAAANIIFKHSELRKEFILPLQRTVREEFTSYCNDKSDSILKARSPVDVSSFSNKVLVHEVELACPFWQASLDGACKGTQSKKGNVKITNSMALISATAARCRNKKMSAFAYRISSILFHSGVKHQDIIRLQKLCLCMCPNSIVEFQKQMGENSEGKIQFWKKEIEEVTTMAKKLLIEVREKQIGRGEEDDMQLDNVINFSSELLKDYENYNETSFLKCTDLLFDASASTTLNGDDLENGLN